jgi:hypothetical protein
MDTYEIVIKGRLSDALMRGTGTELVDCQYGLSYLLARDFNQLQLHTLVELFRDLNIELTSVNVAASDHAARRSTLTTER